MKSIEDEVGQDADPQEDTNASIERIENQNDNTPALSLEENEVRKLHSQLVGLGHKALELAIEIGEKLQSLKDRQGHGKWGNYVDSILGIHPRTVSNYLRLAENQEELRKSERFSDLSPTEALAEIRKRENAASLPPPQSGLEDDTATTPQVFILADGSPLNPARIDWQDGLFDRDRIDSLLIRMRDESTESEKSATARCQQVVLSLVSSANSACGDSEPDEALEILRIAIGEIEDLIDGLSGPPDATANAA